MEITTIKDVLALIGAVYVFFRLLLLLTPTDGQSQVREYAQTLIGKCAGFVFAVVGIDTRQGVAIITKNGILPLVKKLSTRMRRKQLKSTDELYLLDRFNIELNTFWKRR